MIKVRGNYVRFAKHDDPFYCRIEHVGENVLIKGINEEYLSDVCGKVVQDGPSY